MLSKCLYREIDMPFLKGEEEQGTVSQTKAEPVPIDFSAITFVL